MGGRRRAVVTAVLLTAIVAACGGAAPSSAPPSQARATPVITPDPHLPDPTTADAVLRGLSAAGVRVTANNADAGTGDLVKRVNATFLGWPFAISEFRSSDALTASGAWTPDEAPGQGDPPVGIVASNILIEWGPTTGSEPPTPDARQLAGLIELVAALDVLLAPLQARAVIPVPGIAVPAGAADATSGEERDGEATPEP